MATPQPVKGQRQATGFKRQPRRITAWSASRYADYVKCPARAKYKHLDRLPDPSGPAAQRGGDMHLLCEKLLKGVIKDVPPELKGFATELRRLKKLKTEAEAEWAFTVDMQPTGWFEPNAWLRAKIDAHRLQKTTLTIIDFKTGKVYPGYEETLELYAWCGFAKYPVAATVVTELWYLDQGTIVGGQDGIGVFTRKEHHAMLTDLWHGRTRAMLSDTRFAPTPGDHCRWCPYSVTRGGPCKF